MNNVQIEDSINKLNAQMQAMEKAICEMSPELNIAYNKHLQETMQMVHAIQKRRADDAMPGRRLPKP